MKIVIVTGGFDPIQSRPLKGLDSKQWMAGHIVRLRAAGMEDIQV